MRIDRSLITLVAALACAQINAADTASVPQTELLWGDTHLHTAVSTDAAARGNRLGIETAYRFARGEEVETSMGQRAQLKAPLDFLVIADHSDGMGFFGLMQSGHPLIVAEEKGRRWRKMLAEGQGKAASVEFISDFAQGTLPWETNDPQLMTPVWSANVAAAEQFNEPGRFTALIGYEWTSLVQGNNLHRVVIYRDGKDKVEKVLPYTLQDSADPEDLWRYMDAYEKRTGGSVLAIPHNGNLSNGMMFSPTTLGGEPMSEDYARRRQRWEPLIEISQYKGDGETHPLLSPNDEFADFETWDISNLDMTEAKRDDMLPYEYGRSALKLGLALGEQLGVNPYQFGIIASTDSHTSLSAAEEDNFWGKNGIDEPSPDRATKVIRKGEPGVMYGWEQVASGYAAVWAKENTREAIWDAMKRKETYGTTGSRMAVRFFGGWAYDVADATAPDLAAIGYAGGVPMGGTLPASTGGQAPAFLVAAQRDPGGANLDRIQIVKGWLDKSGESQEKVFNVAWGGSRELAADDSLPPVGSTVDIGTARWSNSIGADELATVWRDPDFNPQVRAFYYVRVLEIPTPRWPVYDAVRLGAKLPEGIPMTLQERAYTSPIWYRP